MHTVKVHVRNVMKKWKAKNRTDVAIRAQTLLGAGVSVTAAMAEQLKATHLDPQCGS
jgi:hypothetical protein